MTWTDHTHERCKKLWLDGKSAGEILADLADPSLTRNAVIGVINRAGLSRNPLNGEPRPAARPRPARSRVGRHIDGRPDSDSTRDPAPVIAEPPDPDIDGLILADMPFRGACHYPLSGAGADMVMCAQECDGPYCVRHMAVCYVALSVVQKKAMRSLAGWASKR